MARMSDEHIVITQALNGDNKDVQELANELLAERQLTQELLEVILTLSMYQDNPVMVHNQIDRAMTILKLRGLD